MAYPLAGDSWNQDELDAIQRVAASGRFTMGERVREFERAFAARTGSRHAVMVNSGSSANLIAVASLFYKKDRPLQRGDEVIVPAISWATTYHPLQQYGLKLRFVDVDLETLNADIEQLERALTPRTRMIVAVSILGNPCELARMRRLCDERGIYLLEDNCESMGATLDGRQCGSFGDFGTFSTFFSHHISTIEGGVLVTDDDELHQLAVCLRAHGWTRDLPEDSPLFERRADDFYEGYRFILPGYNVRPTELGGAVGLSQLAKADAMIEARRRNAGFFHDLFANDPRFLLQKENGRSSWFSFTMVVRPEYGPGRGPILERLARAGVEFRIITGGCFLRHDVIRHFDHEVFESTKNADLAHDRGFFVGNLPRDLRPELELLHRALRDDA
ncbi:MAG TPA: DegT/DnrJ/EryC1/StrS family aminotransferase [Bdellovibrionota bacterium]|nr:DegT/DnrJ/EryC1/StrS family aminotransferase [Bdellovibrionota bacterium]